MVSTVLCAACNDVIGFLGRDTEVLHQSRSRTGRFLQVIAEGVSEGKAALGCFFQFRSHQTRGTGHNGNAIRYILQVISEVMRIDPLGGFSQGLQFSPGCACGSGHLIDRLVVLVTEFYKFHSGGNGGGCNGNHGGTDGSGNACGNTAQFLKATACFVRRVGSIRNGICHILCGVSGIVHPLADPFQSLSGIIQFTLHTDQFCFGIVQLDLPLLGAAVILSKGVGSVF